MSGVIINTEKLRYNWELGCDLVQKKAEAEGFKENYDFGFATVKHEIYDEQELEEALSQSVTSLLLVCSQRVLNIAQCANCKKQDF